METVFTELDLESEGILNSSYKKVVKHSFNNINSRSLFGIKNRVKTRQYQLISGMANVLRVCVFAAILITIFS
ncbi:hypothetical protein N1F78_09695 [Seonamhaeicola sp. MEBiC1930]|uniref:hypothetical protein n=1 Tax=Seonamhaeicola sp. MEBiC01930 TaxID=2976768 RepID=UPI003253F11A